MIGSVLLGVVLTKTLDPSISWMIGLSIGAIIIAYLTLIANVFHR